MVYPFNLASGSLTDITATNMLFRCDVQFYFCPPITKIKGINVGYAKQVKVPDFSKTDGRSI